MQALLTVDHPKIGYNSAELKYCHKNTPITAKSIDKGFILTKRVVSSYLSNKSRSVVVWDRCSRSTSHEP